MFKRIFFPALIALNVLSPQSVKADSLINVLDQACGKAVENLGCTDVATGFPEVLGAVIAALSATKGQFSSADDCNAKLSGGSTVLASVASYLNTPGLPFAQVRQCSCNIVYASQSCSSAAQGFANTISGAINDFFSAIGLGGETQPPDNPAKDKADYYAQDYAPHLGELQEADYPAAYAVMRPVSDQCNGDWSSVPWVSDTNVEICAPFWHQFSDQLNARQKIEADAKQVELQKQLDALQKQKDAATDNARKIAMNWA